MSTTTRRDALKRIAWLPVAMSLPRVFAQTNGDSRFKTVYGDPDLKAEFLLFLKNVYNVYPAGQFHALIEKATGEGRTDKEIYGLIQARLSTITPFLFELRSVRPAVNKLKAEMARQTLTMLETTKSVQGFLEVGSEGRYVSELKPKFPIMGDIVLLDAEEPSYSMEDMIERGGIGKVGRFVAWKDYEPVAEKDVPDASLDVVANYIGLHHAPGDKRDAFVKSLARVLRPGGRLLLREHDIEKQETRHITALAHDVYNAGQGVSWNGNQQEVRNFTSTMQLIGYLGKFGLKVTASKGQILQADDPTRNALIEFVKA